MLAARAPLRTRAAPALAAALLAVAGCRRADPELARRTAEEAVLVRQIYGLEQLVAAAETGSLLREDQLALAVSESVVERLIAAGLPQERELQGRFRVRLEKADVEFKSSRSAIELRGRVSPNGMPDTYAELRLVAGLQRVQLDADSRQLRADLALDGFEVVRAAAAGTESRALRSLLEELGRERVESFAELLPRLEIPIALEQMIHVDGFTEGPVSVSGGGLPIALSVARLMPLSGRLWIVIDAAVGDWSKDAPAERAAAGQ